MSVLSSRPLKTMGRLEGDTEHTLCRHGGRERETLGRQKLAHRPPCDPGPPPTSLNRSSNLNRDLIKIWS